MKIKRETLAVGDLPAFQRPAFADRLKFPVNLTELNGANLSELMSRYALLVAFVDQEATSWKIEEMRQSQSIEDARLRFLVDNPRYLHTERWKVDVHVGNDPSVRSLNRKLVFIRSMRERAEGMVRNYERLITVLSRELSRRLGTRDGTRPAY